MDKVILYLEHKIADAEEIFNSIIRGVNLIDQIHRLSFWPKEIRIELEKLLGNKTPKTILDKQNISDENNKNYYNDYIEELYNFVEKLKKKCK